MLKVPDILCTEASGTGIVAVNENHGIMKRENVVSIYSRRLIKCLSALISVSKGYEPSESYDMLQAIKLTLSTMASRDDIHVT